MSATSAQNAVWEKMFKWLQAFRRKHGLPVPIADRLWPFQSICHSPSRPPAFEDFNAGVAHDFFKPLLARLVCLTCAPHPAATGGGIGLAPWENPGPRPPKAGATLSPTGQGKFRRDEQGCFVQKLGNCVHLNLLADRIRHLTSVLSPFEAERMPKIKRPDQFI